LDPALLPTMSWPGPAGPTGGDPARQHRRDQRFPTQLIWYRRNPISAEPTGTVRDTGLTWFVALVEVLISKPDCLAER